MDLYTRYPVLGHADINSKCITHIKNSNIYKGTLIWHLAFGRTHT